MHSAPLTPEVRARNKKVVVWLVATIIVFTAGSLIYLAHFGANFQRHGFH